MTKSDDGRCGYEPFVPLPITQQCFYCNGTFDASVYREHLVACAAQQVELVEQKKKVVLSAFERAIRRVKRWFRKDLSSPKGKQDILALGEAAEAKARSSARHR